MRLLLAVAVALIVLLLAWLFVDLGGRAVESEGIQTVGAVRPGYPTYVGEPPPETTTTTTTARARTAPSKRTVMRAASVAPVVVAESSIRGFPCGGDLPPCYVLKRESMMAADPPRVWNGNCYMPVGSYGQCGRSTASGLWQVLRSTWRGFAGYVNAADAPVDVQNAFARQLWAAGRGCAHWRACG